MYPGVSHADFVLDFMDGNLNSKIVKNVLHIVDESNVK